MVLKHLVPSKRGTFQEYAQSALLFVIALIPLTHILRTANPGYKFRTGEILKAPTVHG